MRFSDSTSYDISKPIKYANSDSSPFSSDESLSDDNSLHDNLTPPTPSNYNTDLSTKNSSLTNLNDNLNKKVKFLQITHLLTGHAISLKINLFHQTRLSQEQQKLIIACDTNQSKFDYRLFIPPSKL